MQLSGADGVEMPEIPGLLGAENAKMSECGMHPLQKKRKKKALGFITTLSWSLFFLPHVSQSCKREKAKVMVR